MNTVIYKTDWIEVNHQWGFKYVYSHGGYHDTRPQLKFYITSLVALVIGVPVGLFVGLSWPYWVLLSVAFLFGKYGVFLNLPYNSGNHSFDTPEWGIYYHNRTIWLDWGEELYSWGPPFDWRHVRHSMLLEDGSWVHSVKGDKKNFWEDSWDSKVWSRWLPYTYILKSGEVQRTQATVKVSEREWRWKWFTWLPWGPFRRVEKTISVEFADPIGEGVGTYKGGVYGCGYEMKEGESPQDTLQRMQRERTFDR